MAAMRAGAVLAACLALLAAACGSSGPAPLPGTAAPPQQAQLGWVEHLGERGERLTFRVRSFHVLEHGWRAEVGIDNGTSVRWRLGDRSVSLGRRFGVMLFRSGELRELEARNRAGELPGVRRAGSFEPALPPILAPGRSWSGAISARGSLAAGLWVRLVFGTLVAEAAPPAGMPRQLVWITDHAHRLSG
jgi:hypothetical protein